MRALTRFVTALTITLASLSAQAAVITYTFEGKGTFNVGATTYTNRDFYAVFVGNTDNVVDFTSNIKSIGAFTSALFKWIDDNGTLDSRTLSDTIYVRNNRTIKTVYFGGETDGCLQPNTLDCDIFDITEGDSTTELASYDLVKNITIEQLDQNYLFWAQWSGVNTGPITMTNVTSAKFFSVREENTNGGGNGGGSNGGGNVPEPNILATLGLGLLGLWYARRRNQPSTHAQKQVQAL